METPALDQLLRGYFHQDWADEFHGSVDELVATYVDDDPELAARLPSEVDEVLTGLSTEAEVKSMLDSFGCQYTLKENDPGYRAWMTGIAERVRAATGSG